MPFYAPRNIQPTDQLIFDAAGQCVGIQPGGSAKPAVFGLTEREKAQTQALVSADGNLAYAAVASTTGTPGEVRKLSDGPDKGVVLVWSIPEGRTTYAWCWQIYPLASYL